MLNKNDLSRLILEALKSNGGSASIVEVCKFVWKNYESNLRISGNLFFTWQYDIRWSATELRKEGKIKASEFSPSGIWELS